MDLYACAGQIVRILICLTYFRPYISGVTVYAERLADGLASLGHDVTVLAAQHTQELPQQERRNGIAIERVPTWTRLSKAPVMPAMPRSAWNLISQCDVVNLHLPQMDAIYLSWMARLLRKPVVLTYQCDLKLPHGAVNALVNGASRIGHEITACASAAIVSTSRDYAEHSPFLRRHLDRVHVVNPPVELAPVDAADITSFRARHGIGPRDRVIGMASRLAAEKGVECLIAAMPEVLRRWPTARVLFVGPHEGVVGEERYARRILPLAQQLGAHWTFLGTLSPKHIAAFFHVCDVLALPSLNSTEAFGMVQVEAMMCGTPVVASDLPGVRQPVLATRMGRIFPVADSHALAESLIQVLNTPGNYRGDTEAIRAAYGARSCARHYERIFSGVCGLG